METNALKSGLINWLQGLNDKTILTSFLLQFKKANEEGGFFSSLTASQIESLQKGLADIENNKLLTNNDFWASYGKEV